MVRHTARPWPRLLLVRHIDDGVEDEAAGTAELRQHPLGAVQHARLVGLGGRDPPEPAREEERLRRVPVAHHRKGGDVLVLRSRRMVVLVHHHALHGVPSNPRVAARLTKMPMPVRTQVRMPVLIGGMSVVMLDHLVVVVDDDPPDVSFVGVVSFVSPQLAAVLACAAAKPCSTKPCFTKPCSANAAASTPAVATTRASEVKVARVDEGARRRVHPVDQRRGVDVPTHGGHDVSQRVDLAHAPPHLERRRRLTRSSLLST